MQHLPPFRQMTITFFFFLPYIILTAAFAEMVKEVKPCIKEVKPCTDTLNVITQQLAHILRMDMGDMGDMVVAADLEAALL